MLKGAVLHTFLSGREAKPLIIISFQVEYQMLSMDHANKTAKLLLKASDILPTLQEEENANPG